VPQRVITKGPGPVVEDYPDWPVRAELSEPTARYDHDVLGGLPRWGELAVMALACSACRNGSTGGAVRLPDEMVFEDVAPRLWEVDGEGPPEVVVVESHRDHGSRLAVWAWHDGLVRIAAGDWIGQPRRWLAPVAHGDFDGDGRIELAWVDRPHVLGDLVFARLDGEKLTEFARLPGLTNHRIGDRVILSGSRDCGQGPELLLASRDWRDLMAVRLRADGPVARRLGAWSEAALAAALGCR